jgi:hypothetical protein
MVCPPGSPGLPAGGDSVKVIVPLPLTFGGSVGPARVEVLVDDVLVDVELLVLLELLELLEELLVLLELLDVELDVLVLVLSVDDVELDVLVLVLSVDDVVDSVEVVGSSVEVVVDSVELVVDSVEVDVDVDSVVEVELLVVDVVGPTMTQVSSAVGFFTLKRRESVFVTMPVVKATL